MTDPSLPARDSAAPAASAGAYYDPYDALVNNDPYPVWKRLRDEIPLYYNDKYDFYALSRWDDVYPALLNWQTYRSGRGTVLDVIRSGAEIPPGIILWEDPPLHGLHRNLLTRVFSPRRIARVESLVRQYCVKALDPLVGAAEFDVIADFGAFVPMRTIGYLLGIPEEDQHAIRKRTDDALTLHDGETPQFDASSFADAMQVFSDYIEWRAKHPSDDLMTELLNAEIEENGQRRRLTRIEVVTYTSMIAGAGNETATRLIGFTMQLLADHPEQRQQILQDRSLINGTIEEVLRYEAPSPVQARYLARDVTLHGKTLPKDTVMLLLNGSANRDERHFSNSDGFDIHRKYDALPHLSFGAGTHHCLGSALAKLEGAVALDEILKRWPSWDVDYTRAVKAHTSSVRGWETLPVRTRSH